MGVRRQQQAKCARDGNVLVVNLMMKSVPVSVIFTLSLDDGSMSLSVRELRVVTCK